MTLTQTAILVKQIIFITAIFVILSIIAFIAYQTAYNYYISRRPPPEERPNNKFGQLPALDFPQSIVSGSKFSYSLDTATGNLPRLGQDPKFPKIVKVYFINKPVATLLSPDRGIEFAKKFNITTPPQVLSETAYRFYQEGKTLTLELDTKNFKFANTGVTASNQILPNDKNLSDGFRGLLSNLGVLQKDLQEGPAKITLLKEDAGKLVPTNARSEARFANVSLWPKAIVGNLIYSPKYDVSLISALVTGSSNGIENYYSIEYTYWSIDTTILATYAAKPLDQAFEELKSGQAAVILEPGTANVSITNIIPGYFLPEKYTSFLQPIYIFEGPQFIAYVGAMDTSKFPSTQSSSKPSQ